MSDETTSDAAKHAPRAREPRRLTPLEREMLEVLQRCESALPYPHPALDKRSQETRRLVQAVVAKATGSQA